MTNITTTGRTFGIEIECIMPAGMQRAELARRVTEAGVYCYAANYGHSTPRSWKIVQDGSLGYYGAEIVSPVLRTQADLEKIRTVMRALSEAGCTVNRSCGLHVHLGAGDLQLPQLKKIAKHFIKWETFFDHILPASRRAASNRYVNSNRNLFGGYTETAVARAYEAIDRAVSRNDLISTVCPSRYFKLNLEVLHRQETIEFRHHSGTLDGDKAVNWVLLLTNFVDAAANGAPRCRRTNETISPSEELTRFFKTFRVLAPVQAFYRARMEHFTRIEEEAR